MTQRNMDERSKKIVFVSNCILNANNKVAEFARYPGMFTQVVEILETSAGGMTVICTTMQGTAVSAVNWLNRWPTIWRIMQ